MVMHRLATVYNIHSLVVVVYLKTHQMFSCRLSHLNANRGDMKNTSATIDAIIRCNQKFCALVKIWQKISKSELEFTTENHTHISNTRKARKK